MPRKKSLKRKKEAKQKKPFSEKIGLKEESIQTVLAIVFFVLSLFLVLASMKKAGIVGEAIFTVSYKFLGLGYFLFPLLLLLLSLSFFRSLRKNVALTTLLGSFLFSVSGLGLINIISPEGGGIVGGVIATPLVNLFDYVLAFVFLLALLIISLIIIFDTALTSHLTYLWSALFQKKDEALEPDKEIDSVTSKATQTQNYTEEESQTHSPAPAPQPAPKINKFFDSQKNTHSDTSNDELLINSQNTTLEKPYTPPPLSLLSSDKGKPGVGDIKANANIIKRSLHNFGINVEMDEISIGPSVTRYALKPAEGVKLSRITNLKNDLALALAAPAIRIEAPIPGKSLVGIEIPNTTKTTVGLGTLLSSDEYRSSDKPLLAGLGKGISGQPQFANLAKMPHMLIAGATGSGKSVTIHAIITSLLFRNSPEHLKLIMIDPKRVELTLYNKTPHLLTPVITNPKKAILALKWATKEMDRRYNILEEHKVRDITSYHTNVLNPHLKKRSKSSKGAKEDKEESETSEGPEKMPYIVIIIDELADIMQAYPRELESSIVRLAQMSRAVGIHLILSTQRPSVNVITGLIKANVPARIALQVASQVDSRTILDTGGAEELLGAGDMLYMSGEMAKAKRVQSSFISEAEVKKVVNHLAKNYENEIPEEIDFSTDHTNSSMLSVSMDDDSDEEDDLYEDAREIVIKAKKASTSYLQRKLRVGYSRAARLMDALEEHGVIGPQEGTKPREVLHAPEEDEEEQYSEEQSQS